MKKKVSIIPLTLSIVIAAAWTLRWAIESRDVSLEEILAFKGVHIKSEEITAFHLATTIYGGIKSSITIKPGDLQFNQYLELWSKQQYKMLKYESEDNPLLDTEDADFLSPARIQVDAVVNEKKICCIISIFPDPKEHIIYFMSEKDYVYQDLIRAIDAKATPEMLADICRDCCWFPVSACCKNICSGKYVK